jgi:PLP dependent protein
MENIRTRLEQVLQRIRRAEAEYGRPANSVKLLAVSKTWPVESLLAAAEAGQRAFGENYLQEALTKIDTLHNSDFEWHYIGAIQSNKTRDLASHFHWVHSVDRVKIARRLSEQRPPELPPLNICLQVNISDEASKSGVTANEALAVAQEIAALPHLRLRGLMAIPEAITEFDEQRAVFKQVRELQERLVASGLQLDTLSMGMSDDMEAAIAEGATLVRIGSAIFGQRDYSR